MELGEKLKTLAGMTKAEQLELWRELFAKSAPTRIRRELMTSMLAYRLQEQAYGGLSQQLRRRLDHIAGTLGKKEDHVIVNMARAKPGTRLIRSWQGKTYTVTIEESGYQYLGRRYRSLSEIAREITGTQWSGPLFFGLKSHGQKTKGAANGK